MSSAEVLRVGVELTELLECQKILEALRGWTCETCSGVGLKVHACPYRSELYQDETLCTCCERCADLCANDT